MAWRDPIQYRGAGLALKDDSLPVTGTYVVNQIVRDEATFEKADTRTDVSIAIPLLDANGQVLNTFRFEIKDELIHSGPYSGGNSYSTRANGLEISLDWLRLGSKTIQAHPRFTAPDGKDRSLVDPTIQVAADPNQMADTTPVAASQLTTLTAGNGPCCQELSFPTGAQGVEALLLRAGELATPEVVKS